MGLPTIVSLMETIAAISWLDPRYFDLPTPTLIMDMPELLKGFGFSLVIVGTLFFVYPWIITWGLISAYTIGCMLLFNWLLKKDIHNMSDQEALGIIERII
jgi:hypothetical protein